MLCEGIVSKTIPGKDFSETLFSIAGRMKKLDSTMRNSNGDSIGLYSSRNFNSCGTNDGRIGNKDHGFNSNPQS